MKIMNIVFISLGLADENIISVGNASKFSMTNDNNAGIMNNDTIPPPRRNVPIVNPTRAKELAMNVSELAPVNASVIIAGRATTGLEKSDVNTEVTPLQVEGNSKNPIMINPMYIDMR
jgi:hypothetical protein